MLDFLVCPKSFSEVSTRMHLRTMMHKHSNSCDMKPVVYVLCFLNPPIYPQCSRLWRTYSTSPTWCSAKPLKSKTSEMATLSSDCRVCPTHIKYISCVRVHTVCTRTPFYSYSNALPETASKKEASVTKTENQIILGLDMADWRALSAGREHGAIPFRGGAEQT